MVTLRMLENMGPPAEPAIPAVLRNAERLGLFRDYLTAKEGKSHWARVVHDMQDNLALERRYNEQAIRYDPALPEVAALFRTLAREKGQISALLRDIASLADPHALD